MFKAHPNAQIPRRAESGAAGFDLCSVETVTIEPNAQAMIDTGIVIECPQDCYARIAPRSGLAAKFSIDVLAGVVDSSYRNTIRVILYNHGKLQFKVNAGDRIAQMIFEKIYTPDLIEVGTAQELADSSRGLGGFGSTGGFTTTTKTS